MSKESIERAKRLRKTIADMEEGVPEKTSPESPRDFIDRRMAEIDEGRAGEAPPGQPPGGRPGDKKR